MLSTQPVPTPDACHPRHVSQVLEVNPNDYVRRFNWLLLGIVDGAERYKQYSPEVCTANRCATPRPRHASHTATCHTPPRVTATCLTPPRVTHRHVSQVYAGAIYEHGAWGSERHVRPVSEACALDCIKYDAIGAR